MSAKNIQHTENGDKTYRQFLADLEPIGIGLKQSSCKLDRSLYSKLLRGKKGAVTEVTAESRLDDVHKHYLDATANYKLVVRDEKGSSPPLIIEAVFEGHVHGTPPLGKEFAERFVNSEFKALVWPYFRQLVFDTAAKMAIGRPSLAVLPKP